MEFLQAWKEKMQREGRMDTSEEAIEKGPKECKTMAWKEGETKGLKNSKAERFQRGFREGIQIGIEQAFLERKLLHLGNVKEFIELNWTTEKIKHIYREFDLNEIDAVRYHLKDHSGCSVDELAVVLNLKSF